MRDGAVRQQSIPHHDRAAQRGAPSPGAPGRLPLHGSSSGLALLTNATYEAQQLVLEQALATFTAHTPTNPASLRLLLSEVRRRALRSARDASTRR
ncbi:IclR family transcriptional regulator domain-containing protein [Nocardia sp. CA-119907]|uniref:IclR family transcriptional regulator domain-containing protein n=1 Tax=Nocardia sp. CA-119907 TaxID=3239973 RepID=UPI003D951F99